MKRLSYLTLAALVSILLTLTLSACGDTPAATAVPATTAAANASVATTSSDTALALAGLPLYSGASEVSVDDAFMKQTLSASSGPVKDLKFSGFITADDRTTVKAFYTDYLTKNGWTDLSKVNPDQVASLNQLMEQQNGGFYLIRYKAPTLLLVYGFDASSSAKGGITNVPDNGSLIYFVAGTNKP